MNKLTSLLRIAERTFHEEQLEINVNDSTKCWKIIKEAVGQNSVINDDNCTFHINGNDVNDKQIISDEFNDYFANIGPNLVSNIDNTSNPIEYVNDILNRIPIPTITESEVTDILLCIMTVFLYYRLVNYKTFVYTVSKYVLCNYIIVCNNLL